MIRSIPQIGDPVLRVPNEELSAEHLAQPDVQQVIDDMIDTMRDAQGAGIAANQVGVNLRIAILEVGANARYPYKPRLPLTILVNPSIELLDDETFLNNEGCLSVPIRGDLPRYMNIRLRALDRNGEPFDQIYRGLSAGTVQHEVDHLNGHLIVDRIEDPTSISTWENFREHGYPQYLARIQPVIEATEPRMEQP